MNKKSKGQGWNLKVNQGLGIWTQYYFKSKNGGWFTGLQLFSQKFKLGNDNYPGQYDRTNIVMLALQLGYIWYPVKKLNLYLRPWAGFGLQKARDGIFKPEKVNSEMTIGSKEYHMDPIQPFVTFHIGYTFR